MFFLQMHINLFRIILIYSLDLGSGWEPAKIESEQEFHFFEENLRTDQNTDYFIGGSIYNDTFFDLIYPVWGHHPFQFDSYSPRTSGEVYFQYV